MSSQVLPETALLVFLRLSLFFGCRKYVLKSLYSDLKTISTGSAQSLPGSPAHSRQSSGIELDSLPSNTTKQLTSNTRVDTVFLHSAVSRALFSWSFTESCIMFFLLMFQGLDLFSSETRLLNWKLSLFFVMIVVLVIVPLCVSLLLAVGSVDRTNRTSLLWPRIIFCFTSVGLYLYALSFVPTPSELHSDNITTSVLARLIVLGTIILGLLSGFGAIRASWRFIPYLSSKRGVPTERDIHASQYALNSIRNDLRDRRLEVERRTATPTQVEGSWFSRVGSTFRGSDTLLQELQGLEALEYQMTRNLESLRERLEVANYSNTFRGRLLNVFGRLFSIYCIIRILTSIFNIVFHRYKRSSPSTPTEYPDFISTLLAQIVAHVSPGQFDREDIISFSHHLSLVLVGLIILSSIRLLLRGVTRALRVTSRNLGASLMLLFLAQLMGIYLLSTVVQLRSSFPPPPVKPGEDYATSNLFSTIPEYEVFGSLFDWSFLISAAISVFVRWGADRMNGTGDM